MPQDMYSFAGVLQMVALTVIGFVVFLRILSRRLTERQGKMLYYPDMPQNSRAVVPSPEEYGLQFEPLQIESSGGVKLRSYFIQAPSLSSVTLIHFHGNAGNIGHRIPLAQLLIERMGVNVVLAEYRGYGFSDTPQSITEEGLLQDAEATVEYVRKLPYVNPNGIVVHGSSLGGAVCLDLALKQADKIAAVLVENTFTSISDMTDVLLAQILSQQPLTPARKGALSFLFTSLLRPIVLALNWRSIDKVADIKIPILFISGTDDELVPREHMSRLYSACRSPNKKLALIEGGRHNETYQIPQTTVEMREFVNEHVRPAAASGMDGSSSTSSGLQSGNGYTRTASGQGMTIRGHAAV